MKLCFAHANSKGVQECIGKRCRLPEPKIWGKCSFGKNLQVREAAPDLAKALNNALSGVIVLRAVLGKAGLTLGIEAADSIIVQSRAALEKAGIL